jgi:hypothetical protein
MKDKIAQCFDRLQGLEIKPTLTNMEKLLQTLYDLRDVYNELTAKEQKEGANGERSDDYYG